MHGDMNQSSLAEIELVVRLRAGNREALGQIYVLYRDSVYNYCHWLVKEDGRVDDVVQETFLRAFRRRHRFERRAWFAVWLHRIAANGAIDLLRRRRRQDLAWGPAHPAAAKALEACPSRLPTPDNEVFHAEVSQKVQSVLSGLSPQERAAFVLRHYENRSIEEISAGLGLGTSAAKQSVFRAVQKLRRALEPMLNTTP